MDTQKCDVERVEWLDDRPLFHRLMKRVMDIVGSILAITFTLPLVLVVAIAIKSTSRGPILFRQKRLGYHGREFMFLKFRSMYMDQPKGHSDYVSSLVSEEFGKMGTNGVFKLQNDPRITPIGTFLRRTSIDELPQFLNVLLGQMSLVGPRPAMPYEFKYYETWHKKRLSIKPGITGPWQVSGRHRVTFDEMVEMDLKYAATQTFWLDLKILLRTPYVVLTGEGAY
jgi:lipopolysaccharide/colanic/teichoic acid biosynthesis glycosyltransferase